jgi:hypothetical protein
VRVNDIELRVQASEGKRHDAGEQVRLYLPPEHAWLIGED